MSVDYTKAPWLPDTDRRPEPQVRQGDAASVMRPPVSTDVPLLDGTFAGNDGSLVGELGEEQYLIVGELRDRVSTRLAAEDQNYPAGARRELMKKLIRDEFAQWQLLQANRGLPAVALEVEDGIFAAVLAELDGLGRLAPLLARADVEDIHFEGCDDTMLRLSGGDLVPGPPVAASDEELERLLRAIGARAGDGQTSREFSSATPVLNVRLKGVTELGARLQAAMDVLPRPAGVIRIHRFASPSLAELRDLPVNMIDAPMHAFLHHAIQAGASILVSGNPGVGKTTLMRALGNTIGHNHVLVTVEDERELGLHLPQFDPVSRRLTRRHAVCRSFESRLPNAEGMGGFDMGDALHEALRMSPTWVIVGEVRGAYVTSLLEAATSGISSVMCTIHSRSAAGVFKKVLINALKATPAPDPGLVMGSLSELDLIVHIHRDRRYHRYVSGVYELGEVGDSGHPSLTPIFAADTGNTRDTDAVGEGRPVARGAGALSEDLRARLEAVGFDAEAWLNPHRVTPTWRIANSSAATAAGKERVS